MRMKKVLLVAGALLVAFRTVSAQTVPMPPEFRPVRDYIEDAITKRQSPSVAIAVIRGDRLVWAEGFGYADVDRRNQATPDSIYLLASVSKPLTATGLMVLVDEGRIDLDKPANAYLPGTKLRTYAGTADGLTIRRLANHSAGLGTHYSFYYGSSTPLPWDEVIARYGFAFYEPGTRHEYSNLAFGLLGLITETVSKTPWRTFIEQRVFDPIGMFGTSDHVRSGREKDATVQYTPDVGGRFLVVPSYRFDHPGASALWSSANDLARFVRMHMNNGALDGVRVLKEESALAMRHPIVEPGSELFTDPSLLTTMFGIGWGVETFMGHHSIWHGGGMPGVSTMIRAFPDAKSAVIVLTNGDNRGTVLKVAKYVTRVLFADVQEDKAAAPPPTAKLPTPPAMVGVWTGRLAHFDGDIPVHLSVKDDGVVEVGFSGQTSQKLSDVVLKEKTVNGWVQAVIRTQEGFHGVPTLRFRLTLNGDRMTGIVVAHVPGYFGLSHWIGLKRTIATTP